MVASRGNTWPTGPLRRTGSRDITSPAPPVVDPRFTCSSSTARILVLRQEDGALPQWEADLRYEINAISALPHTVVYAEGGFMWTHPPGNSSGCGGGPPGGVFYLSRALDEARNANQQLGPGPQPSVLQRPRAGGSLR